MKEVYLSQYQLKGIRRNLATILAGSGKNLRMQNAVRRISLELRRAEMRKVSGEEEKVSK